MFHLHFGVCYVQFSGIIYCKSYTRRAQGLIVGLSCSLPVLKSLPSFVTHRHRCHIIIVVCHQGHRRIYARSVPSSMSRMSTNTGIKERRRNEGEDQKLLLNAAIVEKSTDEDEKKRLDSNHRSVERMSYRAVFPLISSCVYLAYRIKCTLDAQTKVAGYGAVVAWVYMAVEIGTTCKFPVASVDSRSTEFEAPQNH